MSVRNSIIVLAIATLGLPAAFAQSTSTFVGGEAGWVVTPPASTLTASQVQREFLAFRANPVAPDGGRYVGGEEGYAFPMHTYAIRDGKLVCTDKIAHNPKPDAVKSPLERKVFEDTYPA